jgi:tRNA 2-thiouridine synthesizing protein A
MVTVDAKGLSCPQPVMLAREALKKHPGEQIQVLVDAAAPRDNVLRLAKGKRLSAVVEENDGVFTITIG